MSSSDKLVIEIDRTTAAVVVAAAGGLGLALAAYRHYALGRPGSKKKASTSSASAIEDTVPINAEALTAFGAACLAKCG